MSIQPGPLGKYNLEERLGQGGMAEVWKAFDQRLERYVAIKFLHTTLQADPAFVTRFEREARAVASLRHPNIVQIYDFEIPDSKNGVDAAYMVMDYVEGITLSDYLEKTSHAGDFPSSSEIVSLLYSIGEALDYAHQRGLVHRDIKPGNILLDKRQITRNPMGEPILTDFGIAKIVGSADGTLTSSAFGTPSYISPEQALGQTVSAASDIYSLGVILYEMCAGERPFKGDSPFAYLQQHISATPPLPEKSNPAISHSLSAVIMRCLEKDPAARFPTAHALAAAVAVALDLSLPTEIKPQMNAPDIRVQPTSSDLLPDLPTRMIADIAPAKVKTPPVASAPVTSPSDINTPPSLSTIEPTQVASSTLDETIVPNASSTSDETIAPSANTNITPPIPVQIIQEPPVQPAATRPSRRMILTILAICILVIASGSGIGAFFYLHSTPATSTAATLVGNSFFTSSGAASGMDNLGLNDTFQVQLTSIPQPAPGKQYYAWLLPDRVQSESSPRALGTLSFSGGNAALPAPYVDPQHMNLMSQFSRFLVTEEATNPTPQAPSLDTKLWRYYAEIPQSPAVANCMGNINHLNALCHLRHLLSTDPELAQVHLPGGLNYWFLNNIKEIQKWSTESVDHNNAPDVRHKIVDILYLLDGQACIGRDLIQHGAPNTINTPDDMNIMHIDAVPLLDCSLTPDHPGYLSHIHNHLNAIIQSQGVSGDQVTLASQVGTELNTLNQWLVEVQSNAQTLLAMDDHQLVQANGQNLRSQMNTLTTNTLSGGTDDKTGMLVRGGVSVAAQIQQLATMSVKRYTAQ